MENASREYTYDRVKQMIEQQKERSGWEFLFLGANIDAVQVAGRFGIDSRRAVNYEHDAAGTQLNFRVMAEVVEKARRAKNASAMREMLDCEETLDEIRQDYKKRHRG